MTIGNGITNDLKFTFASFLIYAGLTLLTYACYKNSIRTSFLLFSFFLETIELLISVTLFIYRKEWHFNK